MVSKQQVAHHRFNLSSPKLLVVPNGVQTPGTAEAGHKDWRQNKRLLLNLAPQDLVITYVANLRPVKGHQILLEAFRLVIQEHSNLKLLLVGDGPLLGRLETQCHAAGMQTRVLFLGARDDVAELLAITDVFVSSSFSETISMAIMEAMSMGKPIVATNVGGNDELIETGIHGLLVPSGSAQELATAIATLLKDGQYAARLGLAAKAKVKDCFSAELMARRYARLYQEARTKR
jgi:glycosyltransferase involved in cell wall biosynthesis